MKPPVRIVSHLGAVGVGIAIAASAAGFSKPRSSAEPAVETQAQTTKAGNGQGAPRALKAGKTTKPSLKANDFQRAWDGVASRKLSREDRISLQKEILAKWAQVDLAGAMDAAMKEAWDGRDFFKAGDRYYSGNDILTAFSQAFSDRPLDAWALIQSGRYGVGAQLLRGQWLAAVGKSNGLLLASMLGELPGSLQKQAVAAAMEGAKTGPEREALLAKIVGQAGENHDDWIQAAFKNLPDGGDSVALRERWSALPEGSARKATMMEWGASLRTMDADKLATELGDIPADAKAEATKAMLSQLNGSSPGLLSALDFAMATDQWGSLAESSAPQLASFGEQNHTDPVKLAEWGCNLPERPDTVEMYHKAIGRYIRDDLPRAKEWLEAMPEGTWQRENGLAEFSQQALWRKNDPAASQWALDAISDPAVKADAQQWRHDWEAQTGATVP